ncbi:hypothetical protein EHS13_34700 [Paenibacillus psychroresistens]|uniref:DUF2680 domain-containing protein n=1 Tax=Paenibacillus psychroresistens TaxID=1778678 RepID=A0A6B8RT81_9BACL|nr:hypothetical protein [Paenibacillus psychroresistens]QGQ99651.1 hypothetical protein EHS13_34700 [Paenibacillus psychroresistens]
MVMNKLKMLGICTLLTLVLTACGTKAAVEEDTNQMAAQTDAGGDKAAEANAPRAALDPNALDPNAMLMMTTFRGLIQMDKAEGLAITKAQAEPMVTIVQDVITKGELTAEVQTQLEAYLTTDQKKFLTDNATKRPQQRNGNGNANGDGPQGGPNGDAPQGDPNSDAAQSGPNGDAPQEDQNGDAPQGSPRPRPNGNGGGGFGGGGNFQNIGPQLLELLQAKLK